MRIEKKIWPEFFEMILNGKKKFELRLDDFECNEGDVLVLNEWNPVTKEYTGRTITKKVGYVLNTKEIDFYPKEEMDKKGLKIISLED